MKKGIVSAVLLAGIVSACTPSVPKCSDEQTVNLVKEIAAEEFEQYNFLDIEFSLELQGIRTTSTNKETGAYECAADISMTTSEGDNPLGPITYTVEMTDDRENFYVTVYGLDG